MGCQTSENVRVSRHFRGFPLYDNNGVLKQHVHYVYDVFDHLIATEVDPTGGGTYTEILHDVLDVSPETPVAGVPGTATAQPVLVFDGRGNLIDRNLVALNAAGVDAIVAEGAVSSLTEADTVNWDLTDNLGSLRIVLDNSSNVIDEIVYNSFGQVAYESDPSVEHFAGFAGGHVDPSTGLINDYHRWYDPATGRWLSNDPTGFKAGDTNLARYCGNSPSDSLDETGLAWGWPSWSTYKYYFSNPWEMDQDLQDYQETAYLVSTVAAAGALGLGAAGIAGITEIGVVPLSQIPQQAVLEYALLGAAGAGASKQVSTMSNPPAQMLTAWPPPGAMPQWSGMPMPLGWDGAPPWYPFWMMSATFVPPLMQPWPPIQN